MQNHLTIPLLTPIWFPNQYLYLKCGSLYNGLLSNVCKYFIWGFVA